MRKAREAGRGEGWVGAGEPVDAGGGTRLLRRT